MNEPSKCNRCGAPLPPDSPEGLCPRCLIALNLATQTQITGETSPAKPAPAPPLPVSDVAKLFPQLEIIECLGRGGMGAVYKARQPRLDRFVALKILSPEKQGNQKFAERFEREARALAKLHHPNIVTVYDFGEANKNFYLLMEFVDGLTLRQLLQDRKLSPPEAVAIVPKICDALQYAHSQGIVHRDIKPENILMDKEGHVKIADFGIAKILGGGERANLTEAQAIGTPHYMSPEQIERPQTVDHRADIYSLGVVFYEMLTGELPLGKFQPPSKKVQVDVRLDEIVLRALEKEPERRYQQVSEVKTHVETVAATAQPPGRQFEEPHAATRRPASIWNLIAIAAGVAAGFMLITFLGLLAAIAIPNFLKGRHYAQALRDREINASSPQATNLPDSTETWSPTLAPGEKLDLGKILSSAKSLTDEGSYEDALQHYLWYFNHSKNDPGARGVRLSFALSDWIELGRRYPKAKQALIEIRDADVRQFSTHGGYSDLFQEITSINRYLGDDDATVALFKAIEKSDPQLARECFLYAEDFLIQKGDYQTPRKYMGDPQAAFERIHQSWQQMKQFEQQNAARREEQKKRFQAMAKTNALFAHIPEFPAAPPPFADDNIVHQTRQLIEILAATGSKADAENIESQALAVLNDPRLKTAVVDAETKMSGGDSAQDTENILAEQPPVVVETYPVSGARDVPPGETEIRVRFSKDMMDDSWSWSTAWENSTPDFIGNPHYESDCRTCVAKVKLEPGRTYAFWLNSDNFHNFKDAQGQPAVPYLLIFQTEAPQKSQANPGTGREFSSAMTNHPQVVSVWPRDGTVNVETRQDIRIRFSQPMNPNALDVMMSGGFLSYDQPCYDPNRNEFTIPFQLLPGTTNKLMVGWAGQGFRDTNGNPADEFDWQFTTRPSMAKADASPPHIVQIYPSEGQSLPTLTLFQLTFDRPMTLDEGFPYLRQMGGGFGPPSLISDIAYDPASHRFTIPVVLPPDNETKLTLHGFYSADGVAAGPIVIRCEIGTNNYSQEQLKDLSKAAEAPRLIQLLTSMKAARAKWKSGIETVQSTMIYGGKSAFTGISVSSALFKWQGTNQFYEDISDIMNTKTFVLGTDAKTCWLYGGGTHFPPYLNSSPVASVANIDTSIADPFHLTHQTVKSVIAREELIYDGQSQLGGRLCYRIGCWYVRQTGNDNFPVEAGKYEWWIDPVTFLPAQMASVQSGFRQILKFQYSGLNQPLSDSAFQPPIPPDANVAPEDWYKKKLASGEFRFLTIKDGSDGTMSGRLGRQGPNGTTSSGLN